MCARLSMSACVVALLAAPAAAQDYVFDDADGFASAPRAAYMGIFQISEVPASIQEIDGGILREIGALSLADGLGLSASVAPQNGFGGLWNRVSVRGLAGDPAQPGGVLINGFSSGGGFAGPRDIAGIDRIDVVKGPQAALFGPGAGHGFGQGSAGGRINLITKRPNFEREGEARFTLGRFGLARLEGDYTTPLGAEESVAVRLVGFYENADSFRDTIETEKFGLYPSITWQAGDDTTLTYELEYTRQDIPFDAGIVAVNGVLGPVASETFLGEPGDGPARASVLGHQIEVQHSLSDTWSVLAGASYRASNLEGASTQPFVGEGGPAGLTGSTLARQRRVQDYKSNFFGIRAELAGEFDALGKVHRLLIGADFDQLGNDLIDETSDPALDDYAIDVFAPVYGQPNPPALTQRNTQDQTSRALGLYVQDQITLSDKLQLRVGARLSRLHTDRENGALPDTVEATRTRLSPQLGLVYVYNPAIALYASYGQGAQMLPLQDAAEQAPDLNITHSGEVGVKADLFGLVTGTLSAFWMSQDAQLVPDPFDLRASVSAGSARSRGFEVDLNAALPKDIYAWLSYAYTDASARDGFVDTARALQIASGDGLLNVPRHRLNVQISKDFELGETLISAGGGVNYVSSRLGAFGSTFRLPGYGDARVFVQGEPIPNLQLRAEIDNLFNDNIYTSSLSALWVAPGQPRRWRLSARVLF